MTKIAIFPRCFPKRIKQWLIITAVVITTVMILANFKPQVKKDDSSARRRLPPRNREKTYRRERMIESEEDNISSFLFEQNDTSLITNPRQVQKEAISKTLTNIDKCMSASNFTSPALLETARQNAQLFMEQYGTVISPQYLDGYVNHCWKTDYHLILDTPFMKGRIGDINFKRKIPNHWFGANMRNYFENKYRKTYKSSSVCLPNIYLLGFEKSGSTFFWCLLSKMLNKHLDNLQSKKLQADKEPYYWTPFNYMPALPSPEKISGEYIPNFLTAFDRNTREATRKMMALIDGCPSTVIEWPRFNDSEPKLANYCLLPSALPELFPQSKYLMIMREPISMMYSAFWWSFTAAPKKSDILSKRVINDHSQGPLVFHLHAGQKIIKFLNCINSHPTVRHKKKCTLWGKGGQNYTSCINNRTHLLSQCVANVTNTREFLEVVIHRGIYYVHVRKWLQTLPRDRIFFTTMEKLTTETYIVLNHAYKFIKGPSNQPSVEQVDEYQTLCRENTNTINYKKPYLAMQQRTKIMLKKFFEPFNLLLSKLLQDTQFLWSN